MRLCFFDGLDRVEIAVRDGLGFNGAKADTGRSDDALAVDVGLHESWQVESFVRRHFHGVGDIHRLRTLLSGHLPLIHRLNDEEVLRQASSSLQSGHLRAYLYKHKPKAPIREKTSGIPQGSSDLGALDPAKARDPLPLKRAASQIVQPAPNVAKAVRQRSIEVAQNVEAAMLEEGARGAIPFCEICGLKGT